MKTTILLATICFVIVPAVKAEDESKVWYSVKTGVMSKYIVSTGTILYNLPVSASEFDIGCMDWYGGISNTTGFGGTSYGKTTGDEFDFYGGWTHTFDWFKIDIMSMYYAVTNLDRMNDDLWGLDADVSLTKVPFVQPFVHCKYYSQVGSQGLHLGLFWFAGLKKFMKFGNGLANTPNELSLQAFMAYATGKAQFTTGFVFERFSIFLDSPLSKHWLLSPSIIYQVAASGQLKNSNGFTDGNKFIYGISLAYKF